MHPRAGLFLKSQPLDLVTSETIVVPNYKATAWAGKSGSVNGEYMSGFGNSFETEAFAGALPVGRNSPQKVTYGLYAEQLPDRRLPRRKRPTSAPGSTASGPRSGTPASSRGSTRA